MTSRITAYAPTWLAAAQGASQSARTAGGIIREREAQELRKSMHAQEIRQAQQKREEARREREQEEAASQAVAALSLSAGDMEGVSPRHAEMLRGLAETAPHLSPRAAQWMFTETRQLIADELEEEERMATERMLLNATGAGGLDESVALAIQEDLESGEITYAQAKQKIREAVSIQDAKAQEEQHRADTFSLLEQNLQAAAAHLVPGTLNALRSVLNVEMATQETPPDELAPKFLHQVAEGLEERLRADRIKPQRGLVSVNDGSDPRFRDLERDHVEQETKHFRHLPAKKQREMQGHVEGVLKNTTTTAEHKREAIKRILGDTELPGAVWVTLERMIRESSPDEEPLEQAQERIQDEEREGKPGAGTALDANQGRSLKGKGGRQPEG